MCVHAGAEGYSMVTRFPQAMLLQPTAFGSLAWTINPLGAATHCLQLQGTFCLWERLWCAAGEILKVHHEAVAPL